MNISNSVSKEMTVWWTVRFQIQQVFFPMYSRVFFCDGGFSEHFPRLCPFLGPRRPTQTLSHYTRAELKEGRISLKVRICWPWRIRRERVKEAKVPNVFYNVLTDRMDLDILHVLEYIKVYLTNFPIKHKTFWAFSSSFHADYATHYHLSLYPGLIIISFSPWLKPFA